MQRSFQPVMTTIVLTAAMLLAVVPASADVLILDDNGTHDLDYAVAQDDVDVQNSTTVNLLTGGSIGVDLYATNNSTVTVSGGTIGGTLYAWNNSMVNVSGGTIGGTLYAWNNSMVNVSGGSIGEDLYAWNNSTVNVTGSSIGWDLFAWNDSTVTVTGGSIGGKLEAINNSTLTIFGYGFNVGYGVYADGSSLDGATLTGTLANGTPFNNDVHISDSGTVTLAALPEPSSIAMFGIGALGLFGYGRRRRQTAVAA